MECLRDRKLGYLSTISSSLPVQGCSYSFPSPELNLLYLSVASVLVKPHTLTPGAGESPQEEKLGDAGTGVGKL